MFQQPEQLGNLTPFFLGSIVAILIVESRFKGAYCTVLEMEALTDLFGDMDVIDATLPGMADKIIAEQVAV